MKFIPLTILCYSKLASDLPPDIRDMIGDDYEYRDGYVDATRIVAFYPSSEGTSTILVLEETETIRVKETSEQILSLI